MSTTTKPGPPNVPDIDAVLRQRLTGPPPAPEEPAPRQAPGPAALAPQAEPDTDDYDDDLQPAAPRPVVTTVGRAGRGKSNALFYMTTATAEALAEFAKDVFHDSRGAVQQWQVIEAVIRPGLTPAARARVLRKLGVTPPPPSKDPST